VHDIGLPGLPKNSPILFTRRVLSRATCHRYCSCTQLTATHHACLYSASIADNHSRTVLLLLLSAASGFLAFVRATPCTCADVRDGLVLLVDTWQRRRRHCHFPYSHLMLSVRTDFYVVYMTSLPGYCIPTEIRIQKLYIFPYFYPQNSQKGPWKGLGVFRPNAQNIQTFILSTKFCTVIKTTKLSPWVVLKFAPQIQNGGRPPLWKQEGVAVGARCCCLDYPSPWPQFMVNLDRNLKPKLAIMRQCTSVTDRRTDGQTDGQWHRSISARCIYYISR